MTDMTLEQALDGLEGCASHSCRLKTPTGMGTNSSCRCHENRTKMQILLARLPAIRAALYPESVKAERDALAAKVRELEADAARSFNHGVLLAAGFLDRMHDQPTMAADIIREMGLAGYDCSHLDPFDKDSLRKICTQSGIRLKGLGAKARRLRGEEG